MRCPAATDEAVAAPRPRRLLALAATTGLVAIAGCGSASVAELPPPAGPERAPALTTPPAGTVTPIAASAAAEATQPRRTAELRDGSLRVVLAPRARTLSLERTDRPGVLDTVPVGVGPTQVACASGGPCYVTDTTGDALLVVRISTDGRSMRLTRRVYVAGAPYAIAVDRERRRLWVTLTHRSELIELGAHARPHILRRHPAVQQANGVRVDEASGDVEVIGTAPPRRQRLTDPASPDRP